MIRFLLVAVTVIVFLILSIPVLLFEYFLGKKKPELRDRQCQLIVQAVFRLLLFFSGTELIVEGAEYIPADRAVLFVGNHRSYFDIVTTYTVMKRKTGYIAKKEMEKIPLLRQWMENIGCLFLNRKDVREGLKTILLAIADIKAGTSLVIYPEGTRNRNADGLSLLEFKEGSLKIAEKAKCSVIPIAEFGSACIFEKHMPLIRKAKVIVRFGEPISLAALSEEDRKKPAHYLEERIRAMLLEIRRDHPEAEM